MAAAFPPIPYGRSDFAAMRGERCLCVLETYRRVGSLDREVDEALDVMSEWYNGYRFAKTAEADLYSTDMVRSSARSGSGTAAPVQVVVASRGTSFKY